jgi:hypothetical protein
MSDVDVLSLLIAKLLLWDDELLEDLNEAMTGLIEVGADRRGDHVGRSPWGASQNVSNNMNSRPKWAFCPDGLVTLVA